MVHLAQSVWLGGSAGGSAIEVQPLRRGVVGGGRSTMVDAALAAGRLVRPFAKRVVAKASNVFALAWRDTGATHEDQRIAAFRDFALDEACGCELAAGPAGCQHQKRTRAHEQVGW